MPGSGTVALDSVQGHEAPSTIHPLGREQPALLSQNAPRGTTK
jgi:hypothetical protein